MQFFPGYESDFFRNRLTHSLEVGQIAKSIAININREDNHLSINKSQRIDPDLVEVAAWCHDLGHPPFGHTGEQALDVCMGDYGGFEGNAQTLRILTRLEKRQREERLGNEELNYEDFLDRGIDPRLGLALTSRSLASILKYDNQIPLRREDRSGSCSPQRACKGYYNEESDIVRKVKNDVLNGRDPYKEFKTIECKIMDVADDIAYSTYDLEDAFKSGLLTPLDVYASSPEIIEAVQDKVNTSLDKDLSSNEIVGILKQVFEGLRDESLKSPEESLMYASKVSRDIAWNGYYRTEFTSYLVNMFVTSIQYEHDHNCPPLSDVRLGKTERTTVEILKQLAFVCLIRSPDFQVMEHRGKNIVKKLFQILSNPKQKGYEKLPGDYKQLWEKYARGDKQKQRRIVCDFIAGMTDRYAIEYYGRLTSEAPQSMFKRWY